MASGINWLHLTDWHVGQSHEWLWPRMREQFLEDLSILADTAGPWDVVLFSGDFVQRGASEEFGRVGEELERLWAHLAKLGSHPVLIFVPGNHDLSRPEKTAAIARQSLRWHDEGEEAVRKKFWDDSQCEYREAINVALKNFSDWIRPDVLPVAQPDRIDGMLPGDFSTIVTKDGFSLGVVGLTQRSFN